LWQFGQSVTKNTIFSILKTVAIRKLRFENLWILTADRVKMVKMSHLPNYTAISHAMPLPRYLDLFLFSRWRPSAILDFKKLGILLLRMRHFVKFYGD